MTRLRVRGVAPLKGEIPISRSKNASLALLAGALAIPEEVRLRELPRIGDVQRMREVLECAGAQVREDEEWVLRWDAEEVPEIPYALTRHIRASVLLLGPAVARAGEVRLAHPGGCVLGPRPIDFHLRGLARLGAEVREEGGMLHVRAPRGLTGAEVFLPYPSVGATENLLLAAVHAEGTTHIVNAAMEPEVQDLIAFLRSAGAEIRWLEPGTLQVRGRRPLRGVSFVPSFDRIEAGTYFALVAAVGGEVLLRNAPHQHLRSALAAAEELGVHAEIVPDGVLVHALTKLRPLRLRAHPYPGFPTDLHPPFAAMLTQSQGLSAIADRIYENRFAYAEELKRFGARLEISNHTCVIEGPARLTGSEVTAPDLRGGAALMIAAACAEGESVIYEAEQLQRGYEDLPNKLRAVGIFAAYEDD